MQIVLREFNAKTGEEKYFMKIISIRSLNYISNNNSYRKRIKDKNHDVSALENV